MASSPIGTLKLTVDGEWDMEDLRQVSESFSESYGLFYPLAATEDDIRTRLQDNLRKYFWSGEIQARYFGLYIYKSIPKEENLKLKSFSYASLGTMEITGVLAVLLMLSKVAQSWIKTGDQFITLYEKVEKFSRDRPTARRPRKKIELSADLAVSVEEARGLVFELGNGLGFDALSCERLIDIVGNPISALKYLVAAGNEGRKLASLQKDGKLQLPDATGVPLTVRGPQGDTRKPRVTSERVRKGIKPRKSTVT